MVRIPVCNAERPDVSIGESNVVRRHTAAFLHDVREVVPTVRGLILCLCASRNIEGGGSELCDIVFFILEYARFNGKWLFYAPLDLTDNSFIKYTKSWDDWQDDDLDGLTVQQAAITCVMSSDVPLALDVTFKLLGKKGTLTGSTKLAANAKNVDINIPLSGTDVSQIYGMTIDAKINGSNKPLAPNQKIVVKNLKAKVTGYYDKEL